MRASHTMRPVLIASLMITTFHWTLGSPVLEPNVIDSFELIILHNNDIHARFEQTDKYSAICKPEEVVGNKCYGGFARVSSLVKKYRHEQELGGPSVLYLNAGDTYTGTPWFKIFKDRIAAAFLNILKPDAISLGNHELDLGVEGLLPFLNQVEFPVLCANFNVSSNHPVWRTKSLKKSVVFDIQGHKVGVIGYLTPETKFVIVSSDLEFIPEVVAINEEAQMLHNKGVDIILALGHSGYDVDKDIAKHCPLVDAVIGGHSNTFLYTGEQPDFEKIDRPYPTMIMQPSGKQVPVVQAYAYTKYLGELRLTFDKKGNLLHSGGQSILLNGSYPRDPEVLDLLEQFRPDVVELMQQKFGETKVLLEHSQCRAVECNVGNMVADAYINARVLSYDGDYWTDAAIAIIQGGGLRASIDIGNITMFDMDQVLPFDESLLLVQLTGRILYDALEHSVARYTKDRGEFLQMSGMRVVYDLNKSPGERVRSVEVRCAECNIPHFETLDLDKTYGVIMTKFIYNGGDGFDMFTKSPMDDMRTPELVAVKDYMQNQGPVYPVLEGRIKIIGHVQTDAAGLISINSFCILFAFTAFVFNYFE